MVDIRSAYSDRPKVHTVIVGDSMTQQHFQDECDVNRIMKRYSNTQGAEYLSQFKGFVESNFGDATVACSFQEAHARVAEAQDAFDSLTAEVRARFGNDPYELLEFISVASNREEAVKLGLLDASPTQVSTPQ